ncbi:MAG: cobyric acid synthase [Desulfobacteraceae bacterium]|nr:MAG: cobyric acid synthase [Desulfobacteraceae bacterium]
MKNIAVLGTGSDVGKSLIAAAICKVLAEDGHPAAPFKAQNMSNNSGVTPEGLEMGRAQIVQAQAAGILPHTDMNPILLKPTGEKKSQVVLNGRVHGDASALDYHRDKQYYFQEACRAFDRLSSRYDPIVLEGAGSCAEVNLMPSDIVNFKMAEYAMADVILVADIHRGGVFAQIVGTLACLPEKYRAMIKGFIINRFRGDIRLFQEGTDWIEQQTGKRVYGVLPWATEFRIDAEDSVELETIPRTTDLRADLPAIGIIRLPHISNFTDFHPLTEVEGLQTAYIETDSDLSGFKAVIIPGSKNTRSDLQWLSHTGIGNRLLDYAHGDGTILGICGGYQILGKSVDDPDGLEGVPGSTKGLGLLDIETRLTSPKTTTMSEFEFNGHTSLGYEIHMGKTTANNSSGLTRIRSRNGKSCNEMDGSVSSVYRVSGTYLHGFFDAPELLAAWLETLGIKGLQLPKISAAQKKENDYQRLKAHFEAHVDLSFIM